MYNVFMSVCTEIEHRHISTCFGGKYTNITSDGGVFRIAAHLW